jgi:hypothetical protein
VFGAGPTVDDQTWRRCPVIATAKVPTRDWRIVSVAWIRGERAAVAGIDAPDPRRSGLYAVRPPSQSWRRIPLPRPPDCVTETALFPTASGPRSFAFVAGCVGAMVSPDEAREIREFYLPLMHERLLRPYGVGATARAFAFDPHDPDRGLLNDGHGSRQQLRWLLPDRLSAPLPLPFDRVGDPVWAPDSRLVMISATRGLGGGAGGQRPDESWSLYTMRPDDLSLRELPGGMDRISRGAWSPDASLYAVNLSSASEGSRLALINVRDGRTVTVARGTKGELAWVGPTAVLAVRPSPDRLELIDVRVGRAKLDRHNRRPRRRR